jgi:hypothetical protein
VVISERLDIPELGRENGLPPKHLRMPGGSFPQSFVGCWRIEQSFYKRDPVALRQIRQLAFAQNTVSCFQGTADHEVGHLSSLKRRSSLQHRFSLLGYPGFQARVAT